MIEKIMKAVKRGNKRRGRNITIGAVIGFLLSCTAVMGADDNYLWIKEDSGEIKFSTDSTKEDNGDWKTDNPYENAGNIWDKDTEPKTYTYTNNTTLSSSEKNGEDRGSDISYGLRLSGSLTGVNFVNNGSITGEISGGGEGYGIYNTGKMGNIANTGLISGTNTTSGSGYGILNYNSATKATIENITNAGKIKGSSYNSVGYGIYNSEGTMKNITNTGEISGSGYSYGYGITNYTSTMENITNIGIIIGTGNSSGVTGNGTTGYGILNYSGTIEDITNTGLISGTGNSSNDDGTGSGIYNDSSLEIKDITNTGVIIGTGISTSGNGIGSGINNSRSEIKNIKNTGLISGYGESSGNNKTGIGSGINNSSSEIKNIKNTGIISGYGTSSSGKGYGYGINNSSSAAMGDITNAGLINVYAASTSTAFASGIFTDSNATKIGNITNTGVISGYGNGLDSGSVSGSSIALAFGINNSAGTMGNITNAGIISSAGTATSFFAGAGICNSGDSKQMGSITNTGVIYGTSNAISRNNGTIGASSNYGILVNGGDGNNDVVGGLDIETSAGENKIVNKGLIFTAVDGGGYKAEEKEYGKFGQTFDNGAGITIINAKAIDEEPSNIDTEKNIIGTESLKLENGILTTGDSQTITISSSKGYILNGITNTLKVLEGNNELNNSVINAYKTAVVFGDTGDKELTLSGTVVNGGIDGSAAILGSDNGDTLILQSIVSNQSTQNTVVNGNINMGAGADTLTIGDGTIINGTLDGGDSDSEDTLNFGVSSGAKSISAESQGINIVHNITNFENINVGENTNVTLFEKTIGADGKETALKVTGVEEINIKAGGVLNLRIDSQTIKNGRYEGHALFNENTNLTINGDISQLPGGKTEIKETEIEKYKVGIFNLITNGLGINSIIAMNGIILNENLFVKTNSILDKAVILEEPEGDEGKGEKGDIKIEGKQDIFEIEKSISNEQKYIKLNEIYKGIYSSEVENFNALKDILTLGEAGGDYTSVTDKEQLAILLSYLSNIYTETPYSFSSELSRKSMGMFRDIVTENQFRPDMNKWLIMGGLTHRDGGTKDSYYGQNYHGFDTGTADVDVDMKLTGAYALGKYGYSENVSLGVTVGGNRSEAKLPMSKVKGNSGYVGAFAENYRGNLTLKAGAGIQYSEYDADRGTLGGHSYSDKYSDMAYDIYLNGRYSHNIGNNLFLEPYGTLSYTYIKQDSADEGNKVLAIETDSKTFDYTAAKVGVDLKKVIPHEKGKSTLSAGVSYTRLLTGADEENITGRFKGENATDFDILVAHKNEQSIGLNAKYALELENGILFDVKGSYSLERDSHNGTGKNRNKGEWIVGAGLGYKF